MDNMKVIKAIILADRYFQRQRGKSYGSGNYQRFGRIDGLVNNAGVNFPRLWSMRKRLPGSMNSTKLHSKNGQYQPERRFSDVAGGGATNVKQHDGVIVNVSSESGLEGSKAKAVTPRPKPRSIASRAPVERAG